jgi:hypothetical protein
MALTLVAECTAAAGSFRRGAPRQQRCGRGACAGEYAYSNHYS